MHAPVARSRKDLSGASGREAFARGARAVAAPARRARLLAAVLTAACTNGAGPQDAGDAWSRRAPVPDARTEVSATTDGHSVFLLGGFEAGAGEEALAPRAMHVYDPVADRWTTPGEISQGVNHAGLVHHDGRLYLVGGFRENTFAPVGAVRIYDLVSGTWAEGTPMPTPRGALAVVVLDGRIHAMGGNAENAGSLDHAEHGVGSDRSSVGTHEVYDPATNTWTRRAPLPTPRNHLGAAVIDGRIHVVAGRVGSNATMTTHEVYDPATDSWTSAPPLPTGRSGVAVVAHEGLLYVFGGETFGAVQKTFDEAERFDPRSDTWQVMPPMPTARHGLAAAAVGPRIYVLSGGPRPGFSFSTANEVLAPDQVPFSGVGPSGHAAGPARAAPRPGRPWPVPSRAWQRGSKPENGTWSVANVDGTA